MLLDIKNIKTDKDLEKSLKRIDEIIDAASGTPEREELEIISVLVRDYEEKHFPISLPDPIEAIKIRMEDLDLQPKNLESIMGGKAAVSFILNRQRALSKTMIRSLHDELNIPYEVLFQEYKVTERRTKYVKKNASKKYVLKSLRITNQNIFLKEPSALKMKKIKTPEKIKTVKISKLKK